MVRRFERATVSAFTFATMVACSSVPELRFLPDPGDAGDASTDGAPSDDGGTKTCANDQPPPGTELCCGTVACGGTDCALARCDLCAKCEAGALCCMGKNAGQTKCKTLGETCP